MKVYGLFSFLESAVTSYLENEGGGGVIHFKLTYSQWSQTMFKSSLMIICDTIILILTIFRIDLDLQAYQTLWHLSPSLKAPFFIESIRNALITHLWFQHLSPEVPPPEMFPPFFLPLMASDAACSLCDRSRSGTMPGAERAQAWRKLSERSLRTNERQEKMCKSNNKESLRLTWITHIHSI